ncbi:MULTISPECIES: LysR family transcriptional regulator [Phyllobacteriaceae]|jgi:DNA-binding transcriptional LysR family regulator|uniref:HTH lysR-type domain-containing protein n=1 Tax=Mesorhizobium hungaricum TaxID=1566387 RepID=A0A1C2DEG3_9HYPH|nr:MULTISPECIES: LysR family transcriptional regulator [Mesorhizobium]MBN9232849.1 LysR family transcriptional regulator [Mesorhizobium sp.]MDQ0330452.1 DNA-binding transcriptional LysR family regulator [Mesorhizobium sp. YL-MeA3-2017]OCX13065.1 hypothetical protein QV13_26355 [Mesorhizobium hungaricum]
MDIRGIDLNLLTALDALLAEPSVSGAARRQGLSQPAMSATLARLRELLNDPILVRRGNRMVATPRAEQLRPRVRALLDQIVQTLETEARFEAATSTRRFRILANEYAAAVLMVPLMQRIRDVSAGMVLQVLPFEADFEERLASHDCDLVISEASTLSTARRREVLYQDRYVSLCRDGHPRLGASVTLDAFLDEDHVIVSRVGRMNAVADKALAGIGRARRIAMSVPHFLVAANVAGSTDLVATLPAKLARCCIGAYGLRRFETPVPLDGFEIGMAWHARSDADGATNWLKGELRDLSVQLQAGCAASSEPALSGRP